MTTSWISYTVEFALTLAGRYAVNAVAPGYGPVVDFSKAVYYFSQGDVAEGVINTVSGVVDCVTCGVYGAVKDTMKGSAKQAVVQTAQETAKEIGRKKAGKEVAKEIATGVLDFAVEQVWRKSTELSFKKLPRKLVMEGLEGVTHDLLNEIFEKAMKQSGQKFVFNLTKDAAIKGAKEGFQKECFKLFAKEVALSSVKKGTKRALRNDYIQWLLQQEKIQ